MVGMKQNELFKGIVNWIYYGSEARLDWNLRLIMTGWLSKLALSIEYACGVKSKTIKPNWTVNKRGA